MFELRAYKDDRATSVGYTSGDLPMHSDYSFCHTAPAVSTHYFDIWKLYTASGTVLVNFRIIHVLKS